MLRPLALCAERRQPALSSRPLNDECATRVSVVVPLRNMADTIGACLASIRSQTRPAAEIIVVDDGSTDGGASLPSVVADSRVRRLRLEGRGAGAARNAGARQAVSDWVAFLDADDEWKETFLEEACRAARRFPEAIAVFSDLDIEGPHPRIEREASREPRVLDDYFVTGN